MKYMLDTNIIIYLKNSRSSKALEQFLRHKPEEMCISAITMAELEYGVYKSLKPSQNQIALVTFLARIKILPFDTDSAIEYGKIRSALNKRGEPIGANDLLIASTAKAKGLTLITNNVREFARVDGLIIENWT